jgi:uncharacterized protein (TIGR02996 family)
MEPTTLHPACAVMTDHHAFLQAILANPDEDAPRLIYADWLEEQGDTDRAEFIRVQCELAQLSRRDPRRKPLVQREMDLLFRYSAAWWRELPALSHLVWRFWERGCMAAVQVNQVAALCRQAKLVFSAAAVQTLIFWDIDDISAGTLAQQPFLAHIRCLTVRGGNLTWRGLGHLTESPYVTGLTELRLGHLRLGDLGMEKLAQSRMLSNLQRLHVPGNGITEHGLEAILASGWMRNVTEFDLSGNQVRFSIDALAKMFQVMSGKRISLLDLRDNVVVASHEEKRLQFWITLLKRSMGNALVV